MKNLLSIYITSILLLVSAPSTAQETRDVLAQEIAAAQGLEEMFEQQISAQRDAVKSYASSLFDQAIVEAGGQSNAKQRATFERFLANVSTLFTSKEITAAWTAAYGKDLSEQELRDVLQYYQSAIGKKDVASSKIAMGTFTTWFTQESEARTTPLLRDLVQEIRAAKQ